MCYGRAVQTQIKFLLGRKGFALVFLILMGVMLLNFTGNVLDFRGYDVISMYHPMKLLTLSYNRTYYDQSNTMLLIQLVPLLICLPAALSLAGERQTGQSVLLTARLGSKTYLWSKVTAVFVVTTLAFALPFLLEIGLNCVSFPLEATGDFGNDHAYDLGRLTEESLYQLAWLYQLSPYLHAVVCTLLFGAFAGVLAAATVTLSALVRVPFRVLLLLPAFLLLQLTNFLGTNGTTSWYNFVLFHGGVLWGVDTTRNTPFFLALIAVLAAFTLIGTALAARKDCLR